MTKQIRKNSLYCVIAAFSLLVMSCNQNVVYSEYKNFANGEWSANDKAQFDLDITDTETLNNIYLMLRHTEAYPYNNIFLFVTTKYPDGKVMIDTMEVVIANEKGEFLGSGMGDLYDFKVPIKKNIRFPLAGKYQFQFEQGMRVNPLPQIMDFGFEIEKSK